MYELFSKISSLLSDPFLNIAFQTEGIPIVAAFFLGIVGAIAPCQFTGNLGAITIYGNRSLQEKTPWGHIIWFITGKVVVFSVLGFVVWILGKEFYSSLTQYFPIIRKGIGPMLILIGIFMMGLIKMHGTVNLVKIPEKFIKDSKFGSFLMGVSFTVAFCPTMFVLFFVTLMPIVLATPYGVVLPSVFAVGTSIPLIIAIFLVWYFGLNGQFKKRGRRIGLIVQRIAGISMVVLGILDTLTYW